MDGKIGHDVAHAGVAPPPAHGSGRKYHKYKYSSEPFFCGQVDGKIGHDVAHAGVAPPPADGSGRKYHKYYQWVCFTLFFQAVLFYIPR